MRRIFTLVLSVTVVTVGVSAATSDPRDRAYESTTLADAQARLGVQAPEPGKKLLLEVPDIVDGSASRNGAPVGIKFTSTMPGTDWMALLVDRGGRPLLTHKDFAPGANPVLEASLDLAQTARIHAIARVGGKYFSVTREVKVAKPPRSQGAAR